MENSNRILKPHVFDKSRVGASLMQPQETVARRLQLEQKKKREKNSKKLSFTDKSRQCSREKHTADVPLPWDPAGTTCTTSFPSSDKQTSWSDYNINKLRTNYLARSPCSERCVFSSWNTYSIHGKNTCSIHVPRL